MEFIENRESVVLGNWPPVEDDEFAVGAVQRVVRNNRALIMLFAHHRSAALGTQHITTSIKA